MSRPLLPARLRPKVLLSLSFDQPLGRRVEAGGYHVDFRVKAPGEPGWPAPHLPPLETLLWVVKCQWGLGAFERFVDEADERWLEGARANGDHIVAHMRDGGPLDGALQHPFGYPHTLPVDAGWVSAMAQGEAASLLVRLHAATGEERYAEAAVRLLASIRVPSGEGGCGTPWRGGWWPEEYPTAQPSFVLNGAVFALLGMFDVAEGLGDSAARRDFEGGLDLMAANLAEWDLGWWSQYDLYPHPRPNVASFAYQELHETLMLALDRCSPRPELRDYAQRFAAQRASTVAGARAFAAKVAFRLAVPRS